MVFLCPFSQRAATARFDVAHAPLLPKSPARFAEPTARFAAARSKNFPRPTDILYKKSPPELPGGRSCQIHLPYGLLHSTEAPDPEQAVYPILLHKSAPAWEMLPHRSDWLPQISG